MVSRVVVAVWNCVITDIAARGIPWLQLILRFRALPNDLNTRVALRWSLGLAYGSVIGLTLMVFAARAAVAAMAIPGMLPATRWPVVMPSAVNHLRT